MGSSVKERVPKIIFMLSPNNCCVDGIVLMANVPFAIMQCWVCNCAASVLFKIQKCAKNCVHCALCAMCIVHCVHCALDGVEGGMEPSITSQFERDVRAVIDSRHTIASTGQQGWTKLNQNDNDREI